MLKQIMQAPGVIQFEEVPKPVVEEGKILIRIRRIGICGSDIHVYHGEHPFTSYPVTQGHEVSGEIAEVGEGVTGFYKGQKVTIEPQVVCKECYPCTHGKYNLCEKLKVMGFQTTGTASEYFLTEEQYVTPLPDEMNFDEGAMIEPLAVAVHGVRQARDVVDKNIAILGAGPIGILTAQAAKAMGAKAVLITDVSDLRLEIAKKCGADYAVNTKEVEFGQALTDSFGDDKADVIYDCAGNDVTMGQAIRHARKGSMIILVAVFAKMANIDLAVLNDHELDLNTTMMYRHEDYIEAIQMVTEKKVQLEPLMSKHFSFCQYKEAYEYIDAHRETTMKVLIDVDDIS